jgi:hypothetical protein
MEKDEFKKSLFEKFKGQEVTEDLIEEIKKAVKAGYETSPESPGNPVENVEANAPVMDSNKVETKNEEVEAAEVETETVEDKPEVEASAEEKSEEVEETKEETKEETSEDTKEVSNQGGKTEQLQFDEGLFEDFSLGATLRQRPHGNVMTNMKKPSMDYDKQYKESIKNTKMNDEDFKEDSKKDDKK